MTNNFLGFFAALADCNGEAELAEKLKSLESSGSIDKLKKLGYTTLVFADGMLLFFPNSALPPGILEEDTLEISIRRISNNEKCKGGLA